MIKYAKGEGFIAYRFYVIIKIKFFLSINKRKASLFKIDRVF